VDKGVNNRHLTGQKPNNSGLYNKMPNPQAEFLLHKIKDLQNQKSRRPAAFLHLENKFYVHKWEGTHRCCAAQGIL
jgi:hypothetical protein